MNLLPRTFFAVLFASSAAAQTPLTLVLEGDAVPGVGTVTQINNIAVDNAGNWLVEVDTDNADADVDAALLSANGLEQQEGGSLSAPAGAGINTFDAVVLNGAGDAVFTYSLENTPGGTADNAGLYFNDTLVLLKGDVANATGFGAGTTWGTFSDAQLEDDGKVLVRGFADDPLVAGTSDFFAAVVQLDASGNVLSETLIAEEGQIPPGQTLVINTIRTGPHAGAMNALGDVIWCADLDTASPPMDSVCYLNDTLLAQEGAPSPIPGRVWDDIISPEVDINDAGDWTFKDKLDGDTATDDVIVKNGAKFRQEGDTLPAIAPFSFAAGGGGSAFGNGPVDLTDAGDVLWFGRWNNPDTDNDEGLFLNDELLVEEGVTTIDGLTVIDVGDQSENYYISGSGNFIVFEATLDGGLEGAFLLSLGVGANYCTSLVNSTGLAATISASGSASIAANDLVLTASSLPAQPGIFIAGPTQAQIPFFNSFLCVDPMGLQRFNAVNVPSGGVVSEAVDLATSAPGGINAVAGSTYNYQRWNRDPAAGGGNATFSDALEVPYQP